MEEEREPNREDRSGGGIRDGNPRNEHNEGLPGQEGQDVCNIGLGDSTFMADFG